MTQTVVRVENLSKHYGRVRAVHDVSFNIARGEVLGLLGPNGSGKTTILRVLTGYLHATSGAVSVAGFDVVDDGIEARKRVGYVPEDAPMYSHMRVVEALQFMGQLKGLSGSELNQAVDKVGDQLSLRPVWKRAVSKISRGYRQRLAIAQALLNQPELLVLDEPTNGLDPRQIIELRDLIKQLSEHHAILITSHILAEIERVASRVLILLNGRLLTSHAASHHPSGSGTRCRIRIGAAQSQSAIDCLTNIPGVVQVHPPRPASSKHADYLLELNSSESIGRIAPALVAAGFELISLNEIGWDLESLFLELTGEPAL